MSQREHSASYSSALTKNPDVIENVEFIDNTLYIHTSVCTYNKNLSNNKISKSSVPGRMIVALSTVNDCSIKVRITNHKSKKSAPPLAIQAKSAIVPQIEENEDEIIFRNNMLEAHISKSGAWSIGFYYRGERITASNGAGGASYTTCSGVAKRYTVSENSGFTGDALDIAPDEYFYGLGADGSAILLNGKSVSVNNRSNKTKGITHCNSTPFYVSSKNYGVFVNTTEIAEFSFGRELNSCVSFNVPEEELEYIFFAGDSMKQILTAYTMVAGRCPLIPNWSLGTSLALDDDFTLTDKKIIEAVDKMNEAGFNFSELYLGSSWLNPKDKTGFQFDKSRFPDPGALSRMLHDRGIRLGLGVNPYISEASSEYQECYDCNYLICYSDGNIYMRDCEFPGTAILDFTHIAAKSWFQLRLDNLLKLGVDFFEGDFRYGLFEFGDIDIKFYNGMLPEDVNNGYAKIFNETIYDATSRAKGLNNAMLISNCASAGSQAYPLQNCSALLSTYSSMAASIRNALSFGMSGFSCCNIDVPICDPSIDDNLYSRWIEFALFSSHFRLNAKLDACRPLDFPSDTYETFKMLSGVREGMFPYLYACAAEATSLGYPMMRPLSFEFPNDPAVYSIDRQYMLGPSIMVAPVLSENGEVVFYLPAGRWTSLMSGEITVGPCFKNVKVPKGSIPVFVRPNSIIATTHSDGTTNDDDLNHITFTAFELVDNLVSAIEIYSYDATKSGVINILKKGKVITVRTDGFGSDKKIVLSGLKNVVSVSESMPEINAKGTVINFNSKELVITLG